MLPVGIEGHKILGILVGERILQTGLQGRTLAQVDGVVHDASTGPPRCLGRVVGAAIIHAYHVGESFPGVTEHVAHHGCFVEQRDDEPCFLRYSPVRVTHCCTRWTAAPGRTVCFIIHRT